MIRKRAARGDFELPTKFIREKFDDERTPFLPAQHVLKRATVHVRDGEVVQEWLKTAESLEHTIAALKEAFGEYTGKSRLVAAPKRVEKDWLTVYPIADQHNGMLAWGQETGEDYDLAIGAKRLRDTAGELISESKPSKLALILDLGDWQHTNDQKNMTPRSGNILDADGRYFKILTTGVKLKMDVIDLALQKHEKVLVRNIPGNHDPEASVAHTVALSAFYHNNPRVEVIQEPGAFFFLRFGQTLLGAHHGNGIKPDRMAMTMATRRREEWGQTKFHYFYFGHIHHETAKEVGDVRVESFQTLAAKDAHASNAGYNSGQSLQAIHIHREKGEKGRHRVNI